MLQHQLGGGEERGFRLGIGGRESSALLALSGTRQAELAKCCSHSGVGPGHVRHLATGAHELNHVAQEDLRWGDAQSTGTRQAGNIPIEQWGQWDRREGCGVGASSSSITGRVSLIHALGRITFTSTFQLDN